MKGLLQTQTKNACGPYCLSIVLHSFGKPVTAKELIKEAGGVRHVVKYGVDEECLYRMIEQYGLECYPISEDIKNIARIQWRDWLRELKQALKQGGRAILCIENFDHWVVVLSYDRKTKRFKIRNPEHKSKRYVYWTDEQMMKNAWNDGDDEFDPSERFAILCSNPK